MEGRGRASMATRPVASREDVPGGRLRLSPSALRAGQFFPTQAAAKRLGGKGRARGYWRLGIARPQRPVPRRLFHVHPTRACPGDLRPGHSRYGDAKYSAVEGGCFGSALSHRWRDATGRTPPRARSLAAGAPIACIEPAVAAIVAAAVFAVPSGNLSHRPTIIRAPAAMPGPKSSYGRFASDSAWSRMGSPRFVRLRDPVHRCWDRNVVAGVPAMLVSARWLGRCRARTSCFRFVQILSTGGAFAAAVSTTARATISSARTKLSMYRISPRFRTTKRAESVEAQ